MHGYQFQSHNEAVSGNTFNQSNAFSSCNGELRFDQLFIQSAEIYCYKLALLRLIFMLALYVYLYRGWILCFCIFIYFLKSYINKVTQKKCTLKKQKDSKNCSSFFWKKIASYFAEYPLLFYFWLFNTLVFSLFVYINIFAIFHEESFQEDGFFVFLVSFALLPILIKDLMMLNFFIYWWKLDQKLKNELNQKELRDFLAIFVAIFNLIVGLSVFFHLVSAVTFCILYQMY